MALRGRRWRAAAGGPGGSGPGRCGGLPSWAELEAARAAVGIRHVEFDEDAFTLRFTRTGVELDLGAYGKGYAIERAMGLLRESGVTSALLHGGTSSVETIGAPPGEAAWRISLRARLTEFAHPITVELVDQALSVSAIHGKSFVADGREYGHVLDPRSAEPVE